MKAPTLRLILGDQLNSSHPWFESPEQDVMYVMMELRQETDYVRHHIQKIVAFFLAMRHFASWLTSNGHQVIYITLDDSSQSGSLTDQLTRIIESENIGRFEYILPDEYRLDAQLSEFCADLSIPSAAADSAHFLTQRDEVSKLFAGKKTYLMETFYRSMRKRYHVLMEEDGKTPLTGQWNYDADNRRKLPSEISIPDAPSTTRDVSAMVHMLEACGVQTIGTINTQAFPWAITREEGMVLLEDFLEHRLPLFGTYQDAMTRRHAFLFHSRLSFLMNAKILHPLEVIRKAEAWWKTRQDSIHISQVEGFIRQILGWREYMRGIYWAEMPDYASLNFFEHEAPLPDFFWTGDTKMTCLSESIGQSLEHAYAHHIQRLMVTGNFALLLGCHPDEVDAWYLGIYIDALEWVEITNTRGMSQFADGGIVGTKPYVSSANYMHKMGDYCASCQYDRKKKTGSDACPFNSLYWDFYARHADKLRNNSRIGMMYRVWDRFDPVEQAQILARAAEVKATINTL